ncbi:MAG: hypothetical protein ABIK72_06995, partial [candidate division WOR-3 bacterium]
KALIQCEWGIFLNQPNYFPEDKFNQSLRNLIDTIELLNKKVVGYLLTIYESTTKYYLPFLSEKNFYQWLAINIAEFPDPQKWRRSFEELANKFIDKI